MSIDTNSGTWRDIVEFCQQGIETARDELEQPNKRHDVTRGRLKALRDILALGAPGPEPIPDDPGYEA
jgi:hypothetical protein